MRLLLLLLLTLFLALVEVRLLSAVTPAVTCSCNWSALPLLAGG